MSRAHSKPCFLTEAERFQSENRQAIEGIVIAVPTSIEQFGALEIQLWLKGGA